MASTNKTANYNLSQYIGTDKPTYLGDYNGDMNKIDAQLKANSDNTASALSQIETVSATATSALGNAQTAQQTADTANGTATSALEKATDNEASIGVLNTCENFDSRVVFEEARANCQFRKTGKIITIVYQGDRKSHTAGNILFRVPDDCKPTNNIYIPFVQNNNAYGTISLNASDGNFYVADISNTAVVGRIYFNVSYTVE